MKIAYFINTFNSINWGGQATSNAIQYMLSKQYPEAEFVPLDMPQLPFKKMKIFRKYYEQELIRAIMRNPDTSLFLWSCCILKKNRVKWSQRLIRQLI